MKTEELQARSQAAATISLKQVLVPLDFSPLSKKALQYALRLAEEFGAELTLVHVIEPEMPPVYEGYMIAPPVTGRNGSSGASKRLKALAKSIRIEREIDVTAVVRHGLAAQEIVDAAKELDVDLIIIATHGYTGWKHFCIGTTAARAVRAGPRPVLVVREKEHDFV